MISIVLINIRSVSSSPSRELSLRDVSYAPLPASSPSLQSSLRCNVSSFILLSPAIYINRHVYKGVDIHLLSSIGMGNGCNFRKSEGVEGFGNTG